MRVLIVGCGYVGLPLGAQLVRQGHEVVGMRRNRLVLEEISATGIQPVVADITERPSLCGKVEGFDWIINTVSSSKGGLDAYRSVYLEGTRNLLSLLREKPPAKYIHVSSTSVYAQQDGSTVTEASAPEPESATSQVLVETEQLLLQEFATSGFPAIIARLSGIYGPGRGFLFQQFLKGEATLDAGGKRYLNMVHLEDVVGALASLLLRGEAGQIYNLTDDEPVTQLEFFQWLAKRLQRALPPISDEPRPGRKRGVTNKQVSNAKFKAQTRYEFRYPTFREGFEAEIERLGLPHAKRDPHD